MLVWLQRMTIKNQRHQEYEEKLCKKVNNSAVQLWNSEWLKTSLETVIKKVPIIDESIIAKMDRKITVEEVELFGDIYA